MKFDKLYNKKFTDFADRGGGQNSVSSVDVIYVDHRGGIRVFYEPENPDFRFRIPLYSSEKLGKSGFSGFYA